MTFTSKGQHCAHLVHNPLLGGGSPPWGLLCIRDLRVELGFYCLYVGRERTGFILVGLEFWFWILLHGINSLWEVEWKVFEWTMPIEFSVFNVLKFF